jgi:hypothetical protein
MALIVDTVSNGTQCHKNHKGNTQADGQLLQGHDARHVLSPIAYRGALLIWLE